MASTSKIQIKNSTVGAVINGDNNQIGNIYMNHVEENYKKFDVPNLIDSFHGREADIMKLDELFFAKNKPKVVICGLPGFGKTELSKQYAQHCVQNKQIDKVFWVQAEDPKSLKESFETLKKSFEEFKGTRCLYIFDNSLSRRSIFDYEPKQNQNHFTLITSVVEDLGHDVASLKLDSISSESALEIFKVILGDKYREEDSFSYEELAYAVDRVPLGLQIVAGYTRQRMNYLRYDFKLEDYIKSVKQSQNTYLKKTIPTNTPNSYDRSIYGALKISLDMINEEDIEVKDLALTLLYIWSFLKPDDIYFSAMLKIQEVKELIGENDGDTQLKLAIGLLINYSFINYGSVFYYIKIHRLTQSFLRYHLNSTNLAVKYYSICLGAGYLSVIKYADSNVDAVNNFYQKNKTNSLIIHSILMELTCSGCIKSLIKIFETENAKSLILQNGLFGYAVYSRNIFELFLKYVDINMYLVMHSVASRKKLDIIKMLKDRGADVNIRNNEGSTPLYTFVRNVHDSDTFDWIEVLDLFQFDKNLTNFNYYYDTLLHIAVDAYQSDLVEILIYKYKVNINQRNYQSYTPLDFLLKKIQSIIQPHIYDENIVKIKFIISLLLDNKPELNTALLDEESMFLLMSSTVEHNKLEILKWFIHQNFINMNSKNRYNETALFTAASLGNLQAIRILVLHKIDVNVVNHKHQTALFIFINYITEINRHLNPQKVLETLNLLGTNEDTVYDFLHLIVKATLPTLLSLIINKYNCDVNHLHSSSTYLHFAISGLYRKINNQQDIIKTVEVLKQFGARLDIEDYYKRIPLEKLHSFKDEKYNSETEFLVPYVTPTDDILAARLQKLEFESNPELLEIESNPKLSHSKFVDW